MAEDVAEHLQRRPVRVRALGDLVGDGHHAQLAAALHDHTPLPRLLRLLGVHFGEGMRRLGDPAVVLANDRQGACGIEVADHRHRGVVRPVVGVVERAEFFDRHVLNVAAPADGVVVVGMRQEGRGPQVLAQRLHRQVFAAFELVAHHRHLRLPVLLPQRQVAHAVRLHLDQQRQRVFRHGGKVVRAVQPGGGVRFRAHPFQHLVKARAVAAVELLRALEHQVLQQMRGPCGARHLIARADMVRDHEGGHRHRFVRHQQHLQAVAVQRVLRNPAHRANVSEALGLGRNDVGGKSSARKKGSHARKKEFHEHTRPAGPEGRETRRVAGEWQPRSGRWGAK